MRRTALTIEGSVPLCFAVCGLVLGDAAIDEELDARDVAAVVRSEEHAGPGDVVRGTLTAGNSSPLTSSSYAMRGSTKTIGTEESFCNALQSLIDRKLLAPAVK
jgi:hypothetical protein